MSLAKKLAPAVFFGTMFLFGEAKAQTKQIPESGVDSGENKVVNDFRDFLDEQKHNSFYYSKGFYPYKYKLIASLDGDTSDEITLSQMEHGRILGGKHYNWITYKDVGADGMSDEKDSLIHRWKFPVKMVDGRASYKMSFDDLNEKRKEETKKDYLELMESIMSKENYRDY